MSFATNINPGIPSFEVNNIPSNTLFQNTEVIETIPRGNRSKVSEGNLALLLNSIPYPLLSRIVEQEKTFNYVSCRTLLRLGATCCYIKETINSYLKWFVELCLKHKLKSGIILENELSVRQWGENLEGKDTVLPPGVLDPDAFESDEYEVSLIFLASQFWESSDTSEIYKAFQQAFETWNFDLGVYDDKVDSFRKAKAVNEVRIGFCIELIKKGFIENPKYALCIIKKLITGYLDSPGDKFGTSLGRTVAFELSNLLGKLIKNTTPFEDTTITYLHGGIEYITKPTFDRIVERTIGINSECIDWILMKSKGILDGQDPEKAKKVFELFILLIEDDVISPQSSHIELVIEQTIKWLDFSRRIHDPTIGLGHACQQVLIKLIEKGIGNKICSFLNVLLITEHQYGERLLESLVKNQILSTAVAFTPALVKQIMCSLNQQDPYTIINVLIILADGQVLAGYPDHYDAITESAIRWIVGKKPIRPLMLLDSLVKNKMIILNPDRIGKITDCVIRFSSCEYLYDSNSKYLVKASFSIIKELIKSNLVMQNDQCMYKIRSHIKMITDEKITLRISSCRESKEAEKLCGEIEKLRLQLE